MVRPPPLHIPFHSTVFAVHFSIFERPNKCLYNDYEHLIDSSKCANVLGAIIGGVQKMSAMKWENVNFAKLPP